MGKKKIDRPLTEVELQVMQVIWDLGECTIREVHQELADERDLAYTSVATMIKILEQKGVVAGRKKEKAHSFVPLISRNEYEALSLSHLRENLFKGDSTSMVMRLLDDGELSAEDLVSIRKAMLERLKK